jgi:fatty acid desaturase
MTDVRGVGYVILFFLIIGFALSALRAWRWYRLVVVTILLGLGYLVFMTMFSHVHSVRDGSLA